MIFFERAVTTSEVDPPEPDSRYWNKSEHGFEMEDVELTLIRRYVTVPDTRMDCFQSLLKSVD